MTMILSNVSAFESHIKGIVDSRLNFVESSLALLKSPTEPNLKNVISLLEQAPEIDSLTSLRQDIETWEDAVEIKTIRLNYFRLIDTLDISLRMNMVVSSLHSALAHTPEQHKFISMAIERFNNEKQRLALVQDSFLPAIKKEAKRLNAQFEY